MKCRVISIVLLIILGCFFLSGCATETPQNNAVTKEKALGETVYMPEGKVSPPPKFSKE